MIVIALKVGNVLAAPVAIAERISKSGNASVENVSAMIVDVLRVSPATVVQTANAEIENMSVKNAEVINRTESANAEIVAVMIAIA